MARAHLWVTFQPVRDRRVDSGPNCHHHLGFPPTSRRGRRWGHPLSCSGSRRGSSSATCPVADEATENSPRHAVANAMPVAKMWRRPSRPDTEEAR